jgi:hypothetical protein
MNRIGILVVGGLLAASAPALASDSVSEPAQAAVTLPIKSGMIVVSADGRVVGSIDRVTGDANAPTSITVIKGYSFVTIPGNTLSISDNGRVTTTLNLRDIR